MNREIKVKAWDKNNQEMVEVISIELKPDQTYQMLTVQYPDGKVLSKYRDSFELLWYTGLTDRNNQEIYGGDIIEWHGIKLLVRFERGIFWVMYGDGEFKYTAHALLVGYTPGVVIGNKFENPELLEAIKNEA